MYNSRLAFDDWFSFRLRTCFWHNGFCLFLGNMASPSPLSKANTSFSLDLFRKLSDNDSTANIFYSPFSISSALAMVLLGARGNTAAQMSEVPGSIPARVGTIITNDTVVISRGPTCGISVDECKRVATPEDIIVLQMKVLQRQSWLCGGWGVVSCILVNERVISTEGGLAPPTQVKFLLRKRIWPVQMTMNCWITSSHLVQLNYDRALWSGHGLWGSSTYWF